MIKSQIIPTVNVSEYVTIVSSPFGFHVEHRGPDFIRIITDDQPHAVECHAETEAADYAHDNDLPLFFRNDPAGERATMALAASLALAEAHDLLSRPNFAYDTDVEGVPAVEEEVYYYWFIDTESLVTV